jgi:hypothetical protein
LQIAYRRLLVLYRVLKRLLALPALDNRRSAPRALPSSWHALRQEASHFRFVVLESQGHALDLELRDVVLG